MEKRKPSSPASDASPEGGGDLKAALPEPEEYCVDVQPRGVKPAGSDNPAPEETGRLPSPIPRTVKMTGRPNVPDPVR
jgi:hypothetical protein